MLNAVCREGTGCSRDAKARLDATGTPPKGVSTLHLNTKGSSPKRDTDRLKKDGLMIRRVV